MSSLRLTNLSHIDLSVKRLIKIVVICEIHRMIFSVVQGIYDPSSSRDGLADNNLSPKVSHFMIETSKIGLGRTFHQIIFLS